MPKESRQLEVVNYIRSSLLDRGYNISPRSLRLGMEESWLVFERGQRSIGVDSSSGVWLRDSAEGEWHCIEKPCTVGGALEGVEFLIKD